MKTLEKVKKIDLKKVKTSKAQDSKNLENVKKAISKEKDLMYRYPKACATLPDRKKFRTDARRHRDSFIRRISKLKGAEKIELQKEAAAWASTIFEKEHLPKF